MISVPASSTSYQLDNLVPGTVYAVTVTSISKSGRVKSPRKLLIMPDMVSLGHDVDNDVLLLSPEKPSLAVNVTNALANVRADEIGIVVLALIGTFTFFINFFFFYVFFSSFKCFFFFFYFFKYFLVILFYFLIFFYLKK